MGARGVGLTRSVPAVTELLLRHMKTRTRMINHDRANTVLMVQSPPIFIYGIVILMAL